MPRNSHKHAGTEGDAKLPEAANEGAEKDKPEDTAADEKPTVKNASKSAWFYLAYLPCLIPILIIAGIIYASKPSRTRLMKPVLRLPKNLS